ncbi:MAG: peroxidase family protein [Hyphomicrobiaceae bacterium]
MVGRLEQRGAMDQETMAGSPDVRRFRTPDGSYNDLAVPQMGMAGARFTRNVPLSQAYGEQPDTLLTPQSAVDLQRTARASGRSPVPHLNLLTGAWLQFMTHDWFSHGDNDPTRAIEVPLPEGDAWEEWCDQHTPGHMSVHRTLADLDRGPEDEGMRNLPVT